MLRMGLTFFSVCWASFAESKNGLLSGHLKIDPEKGKIKHMLHEHALQIIKHILSMPYIIFRVCSDFAKDYISVCSVYVEKAEHTLNTSFLFKPP